MTGLAWTNPAWWASRLGVHRGGDPVVAVYLPVPVPPDPPAAATPVAAPAPSGDVEILLLVEVAGLSVAEVATLLHVQSDVVLDALQRAPAREAADTPPSPTRSRVVLLPHRDVRAA